MGGAFSFTDETTCRKFLAAENYYRFSGYARYFPKAPHYGDNTFPAGTTFDEIRAIYEADEQLHGILTSRIARAELMLRSHTAYVTAREHGPHRVYLGDSFYTNAPDAEPTVDSCLRDIERSRERHILRFWNHSIIDAGPTPNNVRVKAKRIAGNFEPRSVLDVVASLDDLLAKGMGVEPVLPTLVAAFRPNSAFWEGLRVPNSPLDHKG